MRFIAYLLCGSLCLPSIQGLRFPGPKLFGRVSEFPGKAVDGKIADRSSLLGIQHILRRIPSWDRQHMTLLAQKSNDKSIAKSPAEDDTDISSDLKVTGLWVAAAAAFAGVIALTKGPNSAIEFCSGYLLEQSLSVDNLFVFLVLFDYFGIGKDKQDRVLSFGIWGAIILRGIFIGLGTVTLQQFHQVLLLFAGILGYSSYKILSGADDDEDEDMSENAIVKFAKKYFRTTDKFDGANFFTMVDGVKYATPLLLCLVCIELSDIVFAFDSVPAVFGVTQDPFIVYTSNIFAIAGLRSLFVVLSSAISKLEYLEKAVGIVLGVIAAKLTGETFGVEILTPLQSLLVVLTILGGGVGYSLYKAKEEEEQS